MKTVADLVRRALGGNPPGDLPDDDVFHAAADELDAEMAALKTRVAELEAAREPDKHKEQYAGRRIGAILILGVSDGHPVYALVDDIRYPHSDDQTDDEFEDGQRYYYEEHTCPTNWTARIAVLMHAGDTDPHGCAKFVKTVRLPDDCEDVRLEEILRDALSSVIDVGPASALVRR